MCIYIHIYLLTCSCAHHLEPSSHVSLSRSLATSCLPPFGLTVLLSCFPIPVGLAPTDRRHGARDWTSASSNALYPTRKMRTLLLSVQSVTAVEFETHSSALEISKQCRACLETRLFSCTASLTFLLQGYLLPWIITHMCILTISFTFRLHSHDVIQ